MTPLVQAELLKLRTIRMTSWLLLTCLVLVVLDCLAIVTAAAPGTGPGQIQDPRLFALGVGGAGIAEIPVLVLGILCVTQESRFRTDASAYLVSPQRSSVVKAKLVAITICGAVFGVLSVALSVPLSLLLVPLRGGTVVWGSEPLEIGVGVVLVCMLYGLIGVALGTLVPNQIGAVAGSLAWLLVVEQMLIALYPAVGRWTLGGLTSGVLRLGSISTNRGSLLPVWGAALTLGAYAAALAWTAARSTLKRDVT